MAIYRKKPVVIEARQFETNNEVNSPHMDSLVNWMNQGCGVKPISHHDGTLIYIHTLEGTMTSCIGDFIIKGINGEFYPCKPDIFHKTYEVVK